MDLLVFSISISVIFVGMLMFGWNYKSSRYQDNFSRCFFYILFALFIAEVIAFSVQFLIENPGTKIIEYNF